MQRPKTREPLTLRVADGEAGQGGYNARMVDVTIDGNRVVFEIEGFDKLWAFRSRLEIPLAHVIGVEHDPDQVGRWWHRREVRLPRRSGVLGRSQSSERNRRVARP